MVDNLISACSTSQSAIAVQPLSYSRLASVQPARIPAPADVSESAVLFGFAVGDEASLVLRLL